MRKSGQQPLWIGLGILSLTLVTSSESLAEHQLRFGLTTEGGLAMTGNTLGLSKAADTNCPGTWGSIGSFITEDLASRDTYPASSCSTDWPYGTTNDWTKNSSAGQLDLPVGADVLYAELIWGGGYSYGTEDVSGYLNTSVDLAFEDGSAITVSPSPATAFTTPMEMWSSGGFYVHYYIRSAEVTDFVRSHGAGRYSAGGIPATQCYTINQLNTAGWVLLVAYGHPQATTRNLSIFVGADWVDEQATVRYTVDGFCTPPPPGPVNGLLLVGAMEGDAELVGDTASIGATGHPDVELETPNNPIDNFFASQINDIYGEIDTRGTFGDRNHDSDPVAGENAIGGRQGWDLTGVALSSAEGHLHTDQTAATLEVTSANAAADSYLTFMVAFEIDINAPFFRVVDAASVTPETADAGSTLSYQYILDNDGSANANNVTLFVVLPAGLSVSNFAINGTVNSGVNAASLASGAAVGTINAQSSTTVTFDATIDAIPEPPELAMFTSDAYWSYQYYSCSGQPALSTQVAVPSLTVRVPRLTAAMTVAPALEVVPSDTVTFTVAIENSGEAATSGTTLIVDIPSQLTYLAGTTRVNGSARSDVGGQMPFADPGTIQSSGESPGVIGVGAGATVTFQAQVNAGTAPSQPVVLAQIDSDGNGPAPSIQAQVQLEVVQPPPSCGDGDLDAGEGCDDGGTVGGDGCSASCQVEPGYDCSGEPSTCAPT
ncbi:MAG: hypothetical protein JW797_09725, partial [Bradymonadales bacterium]|nr:hypothetical protein [Bradymonadales bacterium]